MSRTAVFREILEKVTFVIAVAYSVVRLWTEGNQTFAAAVGLAAAIAMLVGLLKDIRRGIKPWHPTEKVASRGENNTERSKKVVKISYFLGRATVAGTLVVGAVLFYRMGYWGVAAVYLFGGLYYEGRQIVSAVRAGRSLWTPTKRIRDK